MRELKFRAWDAEIKAMCTVLMIWPGARNTNYGLQYQRPDGALVLSTTAAKEGVALMQFTGLKDKNGVPIYEGDIFNCIYKSDGCSHRSYVVFEAPEFRLKYIGKCQQTGVYQRISDGARYGVIGNVYENPELLEQK